MAQRASNKGIRNNAMDTDCDTSQSKLNQATIATWNASSNLPSTPNIGGSYAPIDQSTNDEIIRSATYNSPHDYTILASLTDVPTKQDTFEDRYYWAKCVRVIDGDTYEFVIMRGNKPTLITCRGDGYNTAETRKMRGVTDEEVEMGKQVAEYVKKLMLNRMICVKLSTGDKYHRYLGDIYVPSSRVMLRDHLISIGYAMPYTGRGEKVWKK